MFSGIPARITADIGTTGGLALDSSIVSVEGAINTLSAKFPAALGRQSAGASLSVAQAMEDRTTSLAILADLDKFTFATGRLLVDAALSSDIQIGAVEIKNGTTDDRVVVKTDGTDFAMVVTQNSQPLPTGAATAANQGTEITAINAMSAKLPAALGVHASAASLSVVVASDQVVPVSATSLPLPTGASTAANQVTANASLGSIDGKMNSLGQKASTGSVPVVIASDQTPVAISAASLPLPAGAATSANQVTANGSLSSIDGKLTTTANGLKVDGSAVTQPVSAVSLPLPTGASTAANQATGNASLASIDTKTPAAGQATMAASGPVVIASDQTAVAVKNPTPALLQVTSTPLDGAKVTYSASVLSLATATTATDIFTITGSASKTIRVTKVEVSAFSGGNSNNSVVLLKRSTANTGGTSAAVAAVPHDSASAAASATVLSYTANPTTGTLVGNVVTRRMSTPATNASAQSQEVLFDAHRPAQAIVLRGIAEVLAVNLAGVTIAGDGFNVSIEWTEE